jgi:hypothetical protein
MKKLRVLIEMMSIILSSNLFLLTNNKLNKLFGERRERKKLHLEQK